MAHPTSQDNNPLDNNAQNNDPLNNNPQDNTQNDPLTVLDPPQGQDSISNFERLFADIYPVQTSVLSNLDRLDFKNLQLAGVKADISQDVQKKYLIPSKCDETAIVAGSGLVTCSNTTETVNEIKACYGKHYDGGVSRRQPNKWIEPNHYRHIRGNNINLMKLSDGHEGGNFDSFNVCIHCHESSRQRRRSTQHTMISDFHSLLCRNHCEKFLEQRPYNSCHCEMFIESHWRCNLCSLQTFHELRRRAGAFRRASNQTVAVYNQHHRRHAGEKCRFPGCTRQSWHSAPAQKRMWLCCACTGIFRSPDRYAPQ